MKTQFPGLSDLIHLELLEAYDIDEIKAFPSFSEFWHEIEVQQAYEEDWAFWKENGIRGLYEKLFNEFRAMA